MDLIVDIKNSEEFKKLKADNPLAAKYLLDHYKEEWSLFMKNIHLYRAYQKKVLEDNKKAGNWGNGKCAGSIPAVIHHWLEERAKLRGEELTKKELFEWLKKHKIWWTVESL